jgi:hypothetical protein
MTRPLMVASALTIALLILAVGALLVLSRQGPLTFPEDTPTGVVQRFLWAIEEGDLQRAFTYLTAAGPSSPSRQPRPRSYGEFLQSFSWRGDERSTQVIFEREIVHNDGTAEVRVLFSFVEAGDLPFSDPVRQERDEFRLQLEQGAWRILTYPRWVYRLYGKERPR